MTEFEIHTAQSAPDRSKPLLEQTKAAFGVVPNLHAVMAEAPGLLESAFGKPMSLAEVGCVHSSFFCVP